MYRSLFGLFQLGRLCINQHPPQDPLLPNHSPDHFSLLNFQVRNPLDHDRTLVDPNDRSQPTDVSQDFSSDCTLSSPYFPPSGLP